MPRVVQVPQGFQDYQVSNVGVGNDVPVVPLEMNNGEIREALLALARDMTINVNKGIDPRVTVVDDTMTSRFRDIVRINPPIILFSMVGEDPQEFLDRMYKVLSAMRATSSKKV